MTCQVGRQQQGHLLSWTLFRSRNYVLFGDVCAFAFALSMHASCGVQGLSVLFGLFLLVFAAHCKSSMFGAGLTIPITKGRLNLGTWQVRHAVFNIRGCSRVLIGWMDALGVVAELCVGLQASGLPACSSIAAWECTQLNFSVH